MNNHEVILKDTVKEMTRVLKNQPELSITSSNPLSVNCYRWPHGPLHETIAPMNQHVIIAHFGNMQTVERRTGHQVVRDTIREGTITTIPRGSSSRWDMSGTVDVIHFYIPDQTFNDLLLQINVPLTELLLRTAYFDDTTAKIISALHDTLSDNNKITHLLCEHLMLALVLQLIQNHSPVKTPVQQANYFLSPRVLKNSLEILDSSPIGEVTIQALAAEQGMSSAHFCRAFKTVPVLRLMAGSSRV